MLGGEWGGGGAADGREETAQDSMKVDGEGNVDGERAER